MTQSLYLMKNELGLFKIGISKNPNKRRNEIKNSSGVNVELLKAWKTEEKAASVERMLHLKFADKRTHGEWFTDLTIEDIESNIYEFVEWKPVTKPKLIKLYQIGNDSTPMCELSMEEEFMEMTKVIPETYRDVSNLDRDQTLLLMKITSMKAKRKSHTEWMQKFISNNHLVACSVMGGIQKIDKVYWGGYGNTLTASTPMPWFTTREAASAAAKLQKDSWMVDILNRFDRATNVIHQMPS